MILLLIAIGVGAGVLSGIFGIGGGIVIVPALIYLAKMPPQQAAGTSLAALVLPLGAAVGAMAYYKAGHLQPRDALFIAVGMAAGAYFGAQIATHVDAAVLRKMFAALMVAMAVWSSAYALELVRRLRAKNGRLDIIVPRLNAQNEGLRPSRLLMLSPEKDGDTLLGEGKNRGRLDHLLDEPEVPRAEPIWSVSDAMKLDPTLTLQADDQRAEEKLTRLRRSISATAFKTYLEDPCQYWMKQALGMSESKHGEMELDAADFGTMAHAAVEKFGKDETARDTPEAEKIAEKEIDCIMDEIIFAFDYIIDPDKYLPFPQSLTKWDLKDRNYFNREKTIEEKVAWDEYMKKCEELNARKKQGLLLFVEHMDILWI